MTIVTIKPPELEDSVAHKTQGTKVLVGDVEIPKVFRITIDGCVDDIWRAQIETMCTFKELNALGVIVPRKESLWQKIKRKVTGQVIDVTNLDSLEREYRR